MRSLVLGLAFVAFVTGAADAQVQGTDCECTATGAYVSPDPGVRPLAGTTAPGGRFRVEVTSLPGQTPLALAVIRNADGAHVLSASATDFAWSPDGDRLVLASVSGTVPNQLQQYWLYDLAAGPTTTPIWQAASTLWGSTRLRFAEGGSVFLFAGLAGNGQVELALLETATGALLETSFSFASPPSAFDDDSDPSVAGWGFGPDPTRFAYGYTTGSGAYTRVLANVRTGSERGLPFTAVAEVPLFSPCGDVFAEKVQQLAGSGEVTVTLYPTRSPQALPLGSRGFPNGLEVEVRARTDDHVGLLGGVETPIATNDAGLACSPANLAPTAAFSPPAAPVAGEPEDFADDSSDPDGSVVAWLWEFGDGTTSSARHPTKTWAAPGRYLVRLTVTDDDGASDHFEREVVVCGSAAVPPGKLLLSVDAGLYGDGFNEDLFARETATGVEAQVTDSDWCRQAGTCFAQFGGSGTVDGARWSADGARIAFAPGTFGENGIWVMDADGRNRRRLTDGSGRNGDFEWHGLPAWSPDGEWIAFHDGTPAVVGGDPGIWWVRADGTGLVKVPGTGPYDVPWDVHPAPASACAALPPAARDPGCYTILHVNDPRTSASQPFLGTIREIDGDGSDLRVVVAQLGLYGAPRYAPGASRIAYHRFRGLGLGTQVYVLDLGVPGAAPQALTDEAVPRNEYPSWAPDGLAIAYRREAATGGERDVFVSDFLGCSTAALRSQPGVSETPLDWRPGAPAAGPVSLSGRVYAGGNVTNGQGGVVVSISGDASAATTSAPDGTFVFPSLPRDGQFLVGVSSAPGFSFDPPVPIALGGSAVGLVLGVYSNAVAFEGTVRFEGAPLAGVVVRAEGPGGPFEATTDADGRFVLTLQRDQWYTLSGRSQGYRLDPPSTSVWAGGGGALDLVAVAAAPQARVAFTSARDGNEEIYASDLDGLGLENLTQDPASDVEPAWSPDGGRIAFASDRNGAFELFVMDADGGDVTPLFVEGREPAWSPDGAAIVFASSTGLRRVEVASGAVADVTWDPYDAGPRWRRDGSPRITFTREVSPDDREVFEVDLSDPFAPVETLVLSRGSGFDGDFDERPGGDGIAYASDDGFPGEAPHVRVEIPSLGLYLGLYAGRNPSWSPDGERVVADDGNGNVWWSEKDAAGGQRFVTLSGSDRDPDWAPAGGAACSNGLDDDGDGYADAPADPGCAGAGDADEHDSALVCDNGLDDDGDGLADADDPGCPFPVAALEDPPCDDGIDDDGDGLTDGDDPDCSPSWPYWEQPPACGLGGEALLLLAGARALRRRRGAPARAASPQRQPITS